MARSVIAIDDSRLRGVVESSPVLDVMIQNRARSIANRAKIIFLAKQVSSNEQRLSETTPPKYIASFGIEKIRRTQGYSWIAKNTDPAAMWVEYGAHAGGRTFVLRYYPLKTALAGEGATS